jgi:AraC-like DNA-binding protein
MDVGSDFVASYLDAWNQCDAAGVAEHLAKGGTYCDVPFQQQLSRDNLVAYLKDYFSHDSNHYNLVGEVLSGENSIAFQYLVCPDGREDKGAGWMGAEFITMEGESASLIEDYYRDPSLGLQNGSGVASSQRYEKSGLSAAGQKDLLANLTNAMEGDRAFLDSHLSLPDLAAKLGCSINHLSQAINEGHGVSFFDFINRYRVQEATNILVREERAAPSILDVALEVGFNSTSTFYSAFKKTTGQTPAQFRRQSLSKA